MDLHTYLDNAVKSMRKDTFDKSDQLTLGEIILKCKAIKANNTREDDPDVVYDFEYLFPTYLMSWRGSYSELSLGFSGYVDDEKPRKLSDFIEMLESAIGKTFQGYKGGDFTMSKNTPVWVANYGNSGNTAIIEIVDNQYEVIIITARREF